jgi:hypothetical protein
MDEEEKPKKQKLSRKDLIAKSRANWRRILLALAILGVLLLGYGYIHTKHQLDKLSNPSTASKESTQQLVVKVGKLVELPSGETPTTATVSDASKLKNQEFFAQAQNGDKVLIYSKSKRAVLYRPSSNKIIEYAAVDFNSTQ